MQKHPLILVLLAASGISHAAVLCDDLDADAPPVEYAAKSAPVLQKAAVSPQAQAVPDLSNRLGVNMAVPAGANPQWAPNKSVARIGIRGTVEVQNRERYAHSDANPVHRVSDAPVSTFSIDVDTGSYSNIRRMLTRENRLPPADAVRVEEILNYFAYGYPLPQDGKPFAVHTQTVDSPWQADAKLIRIAIQAADLAPEKRPPANLVFLIDTSGSMDDPDKLPLVKKKRLPLRRSAARRRPHQPHHLLRQHRRNPAADRGRPKRNHHRRPQTAARARRNRGRRSAAHGLRRGGEKLPQRRHQPHPARHRRRL